MKYFHLIGNHNGKNFGYTFAYVIEEEQGEYPCLTYSLSKCSLKERQFVKSIGRQIAEGRFFKGKVENRMYIRDKRETFMGILTDQLSQERDRRFRDLIEDWIATENKRRKFNG